MGKVKGNPSGCSKKSGPSSIANPKPRHSKPGYKERLEARQMQVPNDPKKKAMIIKGPSHPVGSIPGVGCNRDIAWKDFHVLVLNESIMRGRGNKRNFERTQPGAKRR